MRIFLSYHLDENTPSYGDRDKFIINFNSQIINGEGANTSKWTFTNNHMGTHIDTPYHFYQDGKKILDYKADDFYFQNIHMIEEVCQEGKLIMLSEKQIKSIPKNTEFLIIKTGYYKYRNISKYHNDNPGLDAGLADILKIRFKKLRCVGFDFISLTSWNFREHGKLSHKSFLGPSNDFLIIEDMDLSKVNSTTKFINLTVAPLRTSEGNGGPVTIFSEIK